MCSVCCWRGTWHWRCYWSAAGGADNWSHRPARIQCTSSLSAPIKDSGRCVTDLGVKGRLGPPRDDSLLARLKNWLEVWLLGTSDQRLSLCLPPPVFPHGTGALVKPAEKRLNSSDFPCFAKGKLGWGMWQIETWWIQNDLHKSLSFVSELSQSLLNLILKHIFFISVND